MQIIMIYFLLFKKKCGGGGVLRYPHPPPKVIPKLHACSSFFKNHITLHVTVKTLKAP